MKRIKRNIFIFVILLGVTVVLICFLYPKNGSFNKIILNKHTRSDFTRIVIQNSNYTKEDAEIVITNKVKINKFLDYISGLTISEYKKKIPNKTNDIYHISIYSGYSSDGLEITVYNSSYIGVYSSNKYHKSSSNNYKITNKELDINYIKRLAR